MNKSRIKSLNIPADIDSAQCISIIKHIEAEYYYGCRVADICQTLNEHCDVINIPTNEDNSWDKYMQIAMTIYEWICNTSAPGSTLPPKPTCIGGVLAPSQLQLVSSVKRALREIYEWDITSETWTNPRVISKEVNTDVR